MIKIKVQTRYKSDKVTQATERARRRFLFSFGGYCQRVAQNSMKQAPTKKSQLTPTGRKRKNARPLVSPPGKPPYYRNKGRGIRSIEFQVGRSLNWVKIGPVRLSGTSKRTNRVAPNTHEFGGGVTYRPKKRGKRAKRFSYAKRPFMFPAGKKTIDVLSRRRGSFI